MIYFFSFLISISFMKVAYNNADKKKVAAFFLTLSAATLVLLASCRSENIGVDVIVYQKPYFLMANKYSSVFSYVLSPATKLEPIYLVVTYLASKMGSLFWLFFLCESILCTFIYLTIWYYRAMIPPHLSLACYLFIYYCMGFPGIRQHISIAIIMYAVTHLERKNYLITVFLTLMAMGFHNSAIIIGIAIFGLYILSVSKLNKFWVVVVMLTLFFVSTNFVEIVERVGKIFPGLLKKYIRQYLHLRLGRDLNMSSTLLVITGIIILILVYLTGDTIKDMNYLFLMYMMIFSLSGGFIGLYSPQLQRIIWNCQTYIIFIIPHGFRLLYKSRASIFIAYAAFYSSLMGYFVFQYVIKTVYEVYPYELAIGITLF